MLIYINYIPLEAWVHCLQTATVNWRWDNISTEIFKKKTDFFQYLAHLPLWKKQESGKTWCHGFSFSCGCIRKQRQFKPPVNGDLHEFQYLFRISMETEGLLSPSAICGWWRKTFSDHLQIGAMISGWSSKFFYHHLCRWMITKGPSATIQILKRILKLMRVTSVYGSTIHVYHRSRLV